MPSMALNKNIGAFLKAEIGTPAFADDAAAPVNGTGIDREGHQSCLLVAQAGAATGSPTGQTHDAKIQDSAAVAGTYVDYVTPQGGQVGTPSDAEIVQQTADDVISVKEVDLSGAKRFIRVVSTVTLTAGTSPTWPVSTALILGPKDEVPAA